MSLAYLSCVTGTQSLWLGLVLLAGCGFEAMPSEEEMTGDPAMDPDDPSGQPIVARSCTTGDSSLELCIDFEDTATLGGDGSGKGHNPVLDDALVTTTRDAELAVQMSTQSRLQIGEHGDFDIKSNLTVSMWIDPSGLPTSGSFWMLDNNKQYALSLQPDGQVRCGLGTDTIDSVIPLPGGGWHHVACTYDRDRLKVYIDGSVAGCRQMRREIAVDGSEGVAIGSNVGVGPVFSEQYVGALDNIQIFSRTWTSGELCAASGGGFCVSGCPSFGGGGD